VQGLGFYRPWLDHLWHSLVASSGYRQPASYRPD
jgi:hypothetical protein